MFHLALVEYLIFIFTSLTYFKFLPSIVSLINSVKVYLYDWIVKFIYFCFYLFLNISFQILVCLNLMNIKVILLYHYLFAFLCLLFISADF